MTLQQKHKFPLLTVLITCTSILLFLLLQYSIAHGTNDQFLYSSIGAPYAIQIYLGQYWGVLTNSFVHISYTHLLLNLAGLWIFGAFLERRIGFWKLFLLGLFASSVTSLVQLTLSDDAGVGLSGVNFFFLAFILGKNLLNLSFNLKNKKIYFTLALVTICTSSYLNYAWNYTIGVEAMVSGLFFGSILGFTSEFKTKLVQFSFIAVIWLGGILTLFRAPWSAEWNYSKGYVHQLNGDFYNAKNFYNAAIAIEPEHTVVKENLFIISVEELSDDALSAHENEHYEEARTHYEELLALDPDNVWAMDNIRRLP